MTEITFKYLKQSYKKLNKNNFKILPKDAQLYNELLIYYLFEKYKPHFQKAIHNKKTSNKMTFYEHFQVDLAKFSEKTIKFDTSNKLDPKKIFEISHQIHRAFFFIFEFIAGTSPATSKLRASIWQSIFTHNIYRYNRSLYNKMQNMTTLITGPSGTGKELVAKAIGLSSYIPFITEKLVFEFDYSKLFHPLQLSAMPETLIEGELFGHSKGAFTGAMQNRAGCLEECSAFGTVFLDEIGEINELTQIKLLRILQNRTFKRLGENSERNFLGKILAATNRSLSSMMSEKKIRSDFYYRLCSDIIKTPTLYEQLCEKKDELRNMIHYIALETVNKEEAEILTEESLNWINKNLSKDYSWPGNFRELQQCVRNILIRGSYTPPQIMERVNNELLDKINSCRLTAEELLNYYCYKTYKKNENYTESAKILDLDRRTIKVRSEKYKQSLTS
ncbi:MAG: sigma 54-interacting transcriptional regulator [Verrucomicrobiota bacterium]|nr:sigma 54-interacting transcriptional regulator [Verrucomicrobiota bacterium]